MCWTTSFLWCDQSTTNGPLRDNGLAHSDRVTEVGDDALTQLGVAVDRDLLAELVRVAAPGRQPGENSGRHRQRGGGRAGEVFHDVRPAGHPDVDRTAGG